MQSIKIDRVQNQIYGLIVHRRAVTLFCFYLTEYQFSLCQRDSYVRYAISCKRKVLKKHQFEVEKMKRSLLSAILRGIPYLADRY